MKMRLSGHSFIMMFTGEQGHQYGYRLLIDNYPLIIANKFPFPSPPFRDTIPLNKKKAPALRKLEPFPNIAEPGSRPARLRLLPLA
jgi:hypothetical protein